MAADYVSQAMPGPQKILLVTLLAILYINVSKSKYIHSFGNCRAPYSTLCHFYVRLCVPIF
jgi:hypothetical protein